VIIRGRARDRRRLSTRNKRDSTHARHARKRLGVLAAFETEAGWPKISRVRPALELTVEKGLDVIGPSTGELGGGTNVIALASPAGLELNRVAASIASTTGTLTGRSPSPKPLGRFRIEIDPRAHNDRCCRRSSEVWSRKRPHIRLFLSPSGRSPELESGQIGCAGD
jgi:hypothetical protein